VQAFVEEQQMRHSEVYQDAEDALEKSKKKLADIQGHTGGMFVLRKYTNTLRRLFQLQGNEAVTRLLDKFGDDPQNRDIRDLLLRQDSDLLVDMLKTYDRTMKA
jgi:hypothetical protein